MKDLTWWLVWSPLMGATVGVVVAEIARRRPKQDTPAGVAVPDGEGFSHHTPMGEK